MSTQIQRRRGTTAQHASFTGAVGETTIDTDKEVVVVHDGVQVGGYPQMRENGSNSALALGSAATPSLKFTGDTNTGIYSPGADQVSVATGGTERLRIDSTGQIEAVSLGTAAAPTFSFTGDPDTGVYSPGANQLAISTGGSGRLRVSSTGTVEIVGAGTIGSTQAVSFNGSAPVNSMVLDSSGRLGIGTSTVDELLHLKGASTASTTLKVESTATASERSSIHFFNGSVSRGRVGGSNDFDGLTLDSSTTESAAAIRFRTGGTSLTTKMTLTSGGSLGIGTTSPSATLQVDASAGGTVRVLRSASSANYAQLEHDGTNATLTSNGSTGNLIFNVNSGERARIDSSGRWLLGTSSDSSSGRVVIEGSPAASGVQGVLVLKRASNNPASGTQALGAIDFKDLSNGHGASITALSDGSWSTPSDCPTALVFSVTSDGASSPVERMRLNQQGALKVSNDGTYANSTGPYHEFVSSYSDEYAFRVWHRGNASQQYGIYVRTTTDQNDATRTFLECAGNATLRAAIRSNGGLANYSANNANLSDRNAKKDISPAAGTWDCIKEWEIVNYRYKDQPDDADLNLGVIAQQVAESCPEVITVFSEAKGAKPAVFDDEGNEVEPAQEAQPEKLGIKEQQMYWMAIKALQEAQVRIEQLEAKVAALESA